jgi:DNA helicase IV
MPVVPSMERLASELEEERRFLRSAHARVLALRDRTVLIAEHAGAGAAADELEPGELFARDVAVAQAAYRRSTLDISSDRLCVGRIDGDLAGERGCTFYIGRMSVSDEHGDPLVIDWRAPAAAAFYRARPGDPMGVRRRRHFRWRGGELVGLDDEVVDRTAIDRGELHLVGEGALLAALEAPRAGRMSDMVGTIQADQDRIIRRPARGVTIVQGGPGTGKTAVALHRAAYLLYELAGRGDDAPVLFIGPNDTFLRYVGDVVPSLGHDQVVMATAADIGPATPISGRDTDDVARIKGDERMAALLARAVRGFEQPIKTRAEIGCGRYILRLEPDAVCTVVARVRRQPGTHNERIPLVRAGIDELLAAAFAQRVRSDVAAGRLQPDGAPAFRANLDRVAVRELCQQVWPQLTAPEVLRRLFASRSRLRHAAKGILEDAEADLLRRPASAGFTDGDVALLDELAGLLGAEAADSGSANGRRAGDLAGESFQLVETALAEEMQAALENRTADCPRCQLEMAYGRADDGTLTLTCTNFNCPAGTRPAHDIIGDDVAQFLSAILEELSDRYADLDVFTPRVADRHYHHIVVDEAQDISAMQWRAIARRCPSRALTVVGDLDQASQPWSIRDWAPVLELGGADDAELLELTVNYRTPAEVMGFAVSEVARHGRTVSAPAAIRSSGVQPEVRRDSITNLEQLLAEARAAIGEAGTVIAVVPEDRARPDDDDVLTATETKGLEFDGVVVFDPAAIANESPLGATRLYVALTRTTRLLWTVEPPSDDPGSVLPAEA